MPDKEPAEKNQVLGVEVFMPGNHGGEQYSEDDLDTLVSNTNAVITKNLHEPPGKLGHDENQTFAKASGLPAIGWVTRLYREGRKLKADFRDVPKLMLKAFKERLYKKVSVELYPTKASEHYFGLKGWTLRAVAFLGGDIPEVKGLQSFALAELASHKVSPATEEEVTILTFDSKDGEGEGGDGPLMVPANRHPHGALVKPKDRSQGLDPAKKYQVHAQHPDGSYDVHPMGGGYMDGDKGRFVPHDALQLCAEQHLPASELLPGAPARSNASPKQEGGPMPEKEQAQIAELSTKLTEAEATAKTERDARIKLEKDNREKEVKVFCEKYRTILTPALQPKFHALMAASSGVAKFDEKGAELPFHEALKQFTEELIKAKPVMLGELTLAAEKGVAMAEKDAMAIKMMEEPFLVHKTPEFVRPGTKVPELANGYLAVAATQYMEERIGKGLPCSFKDALIHATTLERIQIREAQIKGGVA